MDFLNGVIHETRIICQGQRTMTVSVLATPHNRDAASTLLVWIALVRRTVGRCCLATVFTFHVRR